MTQPTNPWGLTAAQAAAVQATVDHGCNKAVARSLGLSIKTVEAHMTKARHKMGKTHRVQMAVTWDRWARSSSSDQGGPT